VSIRAGRGCEIPTKTPLKLDPEIVGGKTEFKYVFDLCPVNYVKPEDRSMISLFSLWKQGKMLDAGGVGDQQSKYIDAMVFLDGLWNTHEREAIERARK